MDDCIFKTFASNKIRFSLHLKNPRNFVNKIRKILFVLVLQWIHYKEKMFTIEIEDEREELCSDIQTNTKRLLLKKYI